MIELLLIISTLGGFILFVYLLSDEHLDREQKRIIKEAVKEKLSIDDFLEGDDEK